MWQPEQRWVNSSAPACIGARRRDADLLRAARGGEGRDGDRSNALMKRTLTGRLMRAGSYGSHPPMTGGAQRKLAGASWRAKLWAGHRRRPHDGRLGAASATVQHGRQPSEYRRRAPERPGAAAAC